MSNADEEMLQMMQNLHMADGKGGALETTDKLTLKKHLVTTLWGRDHRMQVESAVSLMTFFHYLFPEGACWEPENSQQIMNIIEYCVRKNHCKDCYKRFCDCISLPSTPVTVYYLEQLHHLATKYNSDVEISLNFVNIAIIVLSTQPQTDSVVSHMLHFTALLMSMNQRPVAVNLLMKLKDSAEISKTNYLWLIRLVKLLMTTDIDSALHVLHVVMGASIENGQNLDFYKLKMDRILNRIAMEPQLWESAHDIVTQLLHSEAYFPTTQTCRVDRLLTLLQAKWIHHSHFREYLKLADTTGHFQLAYQRGMLEFVLDRFRPESYMKLSAIAQWLLTFLERGCVQYASNELCNRENLLEHLLDEEFPRDVLLAMKIRRITEKIFTIPG